MPGNTEKRIQMHGKREHRENGNTEKEHHVKTQTHVDIKGRQEDI